MHIILVGPTNSGKSTQAKMLIEKFPDRYDIIDVGQILRERSKVIDDTGRYLKDCITQWIWASPDLVGDLMFEEIRLTIDRAKFCVMAFSRLNEETAKKIKHLISPDNTHIFLLNDATEAVLLERSVERNRSDDTTEIVHKKIAEYFSDLKNRISIWERYDYILQNIDASLSAQEVFEEICGRIKGQ